MRLLQWPKVMRTSILYIWGPENSQRTIIKKINKQKLAVIIQWCWCCQSSSSIQSTDPKPWTTSRVGPDSLSQHDTQEQHTLFHPLVMVSTCPWGIVWTDDNSKQILLGNRKTRLDQNPWTNSHQQHSRGHYSHLISVSSGCEGSICW